MSAPSISQLVAISVAIGFSMPSLAAAQQVHASRTQVAAQGKSVDPVVAYTRKFIRNMHDYTQSVVDNKTEQQAALKSSVLTDVQNIRTTLKGRGLENADKLILALNDFDGSVDHMKSLWSIIADLMSDIAVQHGNIVFHQIVAGDAAGSKK